MCDVKWQVLRPSRGLEMEGAAHGAVWLPEVSTYTGSKVCIRKFVLYCAL